jgi:Ku protein
MKQQGSVVEGDRKGRGHELSNSKYVLIEPEELDAVEVLGTHTIDIDKFVPVEEIHKRGYERAYYVVADHKTGEEAFAVIREAMKDKSRVALERLVNREHILAIEPRAKKVKNEMRRYKRGKAKSGPGSKGGKVKSKKQVIESLPHQSADGRDDRLNHRNRQYVG